MSRRGAGSGRTKRATQPREIELVETPALARKVVAVAKELLREGLDAGQVSSLFTDAAAMLSKQKHGFTREEWLTLCEELYDRDEPVAEVVRRGIRLTAPGGVA